MRLSPAACPSSSNTSALQSRHDSPPPAAKAAVSAAQQLLRHQQRGSGRRGSGRLGASGSAGSLVSLASSSSSSSLRSISSGGTPRLASSHRSSGRRSRMVLLSAAAPPAPAETSAPSIAVEFSNSEDPQCTVIRLSGRTDTAVLMQITAVFTASNIAVSSASINTGSEGVVLDEFRVTDSLGGKLAEERWGPLRQQLLNVLSASLRSSMPAIFGMPSAEGAGEMTVQRVASVDDANALEAAAHEMAQAAAALVATEREIVTLAAAGAEASLLASKAGERSEASALLERKMAAMEAVLTARRKAIELVVAEPEIKVPDFFQPPPVKTTGPAAGSGYEIILQAFNWESWREGWYRKLTGMADEIGEQGFTAVWLPPCSDAVSPQGYLPRDLYDLNSKYGTEAELRDCIAAFHENNVKVIADIVINHRCAHYQGDDKKWNKFGGRLAWDKSVICSNNPAFGGTGGWKKTDDYPAAPNLDHSQERVRKDIIEWLRFLRNSIGYDGWRFDYVKGYEGRFVREYVDATVPEMAFGEFWDTCCYTDGVLNYNQDPHRQRTVDWCDATGATTAAFDFTTKGILQEAVSRKEYWRLIDNQGRPPGMLGMWSSRAITFLENHDTGSTLNHWPFPWKHLGEGYAYLLTHPGTPCVFWDHLFDNGLRESILDLVKLRRRLGINYKSEVAIRKAYNDLYAATVDKKVAMKIGPGDWSPTHDKLDVGQREWKLVASGFQWAVWEAIF